MRLFEKIFGKFWKKYLENFGKIFEPKVFMTSVRVLLLPSIIKAMVRASKSLVVGWWGGGGLFDYSVSPGPFF